MPSSNLPSFLGASQASLAVLLTISYGAIASRFNFLKGSSRDISRTCMRLFLPAFIITNVESELHLNTVYRYILITSKYKPKSSSDITNKRPQFGRYSTFFPQWRWVRRWNEFSNSLPGRFLRYASTIRRHSCYCLCNLWKHQGIEGPYGRWRQHFFYCGR